MANKTIEIDVVVNGKMEKAQLSAKKLKQTLDGVDDSTAKLNKSNGQLYRNQQGVAQNTSNTTKAFAKQSQGMGGLVRVYATLAANAFAASAAFSLLQRNAALSQLEAGLEAVGYASGKNLGYLSKQLRDVTDNALSLEQSFRATAQATSAGFDAGQLQRLAGVAKGASLALGRDLGDALDRLVRGTAKIEPEILDELGIFVRLDDAVKAYATTLGKQENQLTQYERSQAFLNATLEQGEKKFDLIKNQIEVNPYDQVAASLANLRESFLDLANTILGPIVSALSESKIALVGLITLFGSTISSSLLGSIQESITEATNAAKLAADEMKTLQKGALGKYQKTQSKFTESTAALGDKAPKAFKEIAPTLSEGKGSAEEFAKAQTSLNRSLSQTIARLKKLNQANKELGDTQDETSKAALVKNNLEIEALKEKKRQLKQLQTQTTILSETQEAASVQNLAYLQAEKLAQIANMEAKVMTTIANSTIAQGFGIKAAVQGFKDLWKGATGALGRIDALSRGIGFLFQVGLKALPWIGGAVMFIGGAWNLVSGIFEKSAIEKKIEELGDSFESLTKINATYQTQMALSSNENERFTASLSTMAGVIGQLKNAFSSLEATKMEESIKKATEAIQKRIKAQETEKASGGYNPYTGSASLGRSMVATTAEQTAKAAQAEASKYSEAEIGGIIAPYLAKLQAQPKLAELIGEKRIQEIKNLAKEGGMSVAQLNQELAKIADPVLTAEAAMKGLDSSFSNLQRHLTKLGGKTDTIFTPVLNQLESLGNELDAMALKGAVSFDQLTEAQASAVNDMKSALNKEIWSDAGDDLAKQIQASTSIMSLGTLTPREIIDEYRKVFKELDDNLRTSQTAMQKLQFEAKKVGELRKLAPEYEQAVIDKENQIVDEKLKQIKYQEKQARLTLKGTELTAQLAALELQRTVVQEERVETHEATYRLLQAQGQIQQELIDNAKKELEISKGMFAIEKQRSDMRKQAAMRAYEQQQGFSSNFSGRQEKMQAKFAYQEALKLQQAQKDAIEQERQIKLNTMELEYMLLDAKYDYLATEAKDNKALQERIIAARARLGMPEYNPQGVALTTGDENGLYARQRALINAQATAANEQLTEDIANLEYQWQKAFSPIDNVLQTAAQGFETFLNDSVNAIFDSLWDKTMNLKDKLKDIAKNLLQTIQKAVTQELIVKPVLDLFFPDKELGSSTSNPMYVSVVGAGNTLSTAAAVIGSGNIKNPTEGLLQEIVVTAKKKEIPGEKKSGGYFDNLFGTGKGDVVTQTGANGEGMEGVTLTKAKGSMGNFLGSLGDIFDKNADGGLVEKLGTAFEAGGNMFGDLFSGLGNMFGDLFGNIFQSLFGAGGGISALFGFKNGGIMSEGRKVQGYSTGGIASGSRRGHLAMLHGTEAVVPLPNGKSIPVQMNGSGQQMNNVTVNVSVDNQGKASSKTMGDSMDAQNLGNMIAQAVQRELQNQKRSGGILNPYGAS